MALSNILASIDHLSSFIPVASFLGLLLCLCCSCLLQCVRHKEDSSLKSRSITTNRFTIVLIILYLLSSFASHKNGLHDLIQGTDPLLDQILDKSPSIKEGPSAPIFWSNRHMQFVPWMIQNEIHREGIPFQRIEFEVKACEDKSKGADCELSPLMNENITLDIFPPFQDFDSEFNENFNKSSPIIFFMPGLRCYSQDMPGNMIIRRAYAEGFRSLVVNRRGHTPGVPLKAPRWNLFGDVDDLEQVYWHVKNNFLDPNTPIFLHGISSGTAVVVSALSEWDNRREERSDRASPSFVASISVTPGYDTSKVLRPARFKFPYNDILSPMVKDHFVVQNEELLRKYDSDAVDAVLKAKSLQELVDAAAPFAGYPNASEYYKKENPINDLQFISTPKLVLNAFDDPCCDIENLYERSSHDHHDGKTYADIARDSRRVIIAVTRTGSHCPFLDGSFFPFISDPLYGGWMINSWADKVSIEYYRAALEVYGNRRFL